MKPNTIFNITVCIIGIAILLIHIINVFFKKDRRKDENRLLNFLIFTTIHFTTYLTFSLVKESYTSDPFIISFYTIFYIFNNIEALLVFFYLLSYVELAPKDRKILSFINLGAFFIFVILDIINIFTGIFFTSEGGVYTRSKLMILSQSYQFIVFIMVVVVSLVNKKLVLREKVGFLLYSILPGFAIILQNAFPGYAIAYLSIIISIEILFFVLNVQKNIDLAKEEEKNKEAQIKLMMSQIQPHFIYNSLSSISTLITLDPLKAQKALDDFTEYLRHNLSSLTETKLIPFSDELKHIETYLSLEQVRFNDRIKVNYDIETKDFYVPPLSIQPIVENAVKHGILKRLEGGTISIKTRETETSYIVEIKDDGVGFNIFDVNFTNNKHIGINNIKDRLKSMCNGELEINSELGKGALAVVTFYK